MSVSPATLKGMAREVEVRLGTYLDIPTTIDGLLGLEKLIECIELHAKELEEDRGITVSVGHLKNLFSRVVAAQFQLRRTVA